VQVQRICRRYEAGVLAFGGLTGALKVAAQVVVRVSVIAP